MASQEHFEIRIPSDTAEGLAVQERIIARMEEHGFPPRDCFGMRLALEEALVNAIKHGNGLDPDKQVRVCCDLSDESVRVEIEDEGPGFNPDDIPDPTEEEFLERPGGRGIMLMRHYMSYITYNDRGNMITIEKLRGPAPSAS